jgi:outer membrane biosynthesis protein TonB
MKSCYVGLVGADPGLVLAVIRRRQHPATGGLMHIDIAGHRTLRMTVSAIFVLAVSTACSKQTEPQPSPQATPPVAPAPTPAPAAQPTAAAPAPAPPPASEPAKAPAAPAATATAPTSAPKKEEKAAPAAAPTPPAKAEEPKKAEAPAPAKESAPAAAKGSALLARAKAGPPDPKTVRLWGAKCASCHGDDGRGKTTQGEKAGIGDMTSASYWGNLDDARLRKAVSEGFTREKDGKTQEMKAYGDTLTAEQIDALLAMALSFRN